MVYRTLRPEQPIRQPDRSTVLERREPCVVKAARTVLMGLGGGNTTWLPGTL
jgi:hypothetical protein